MNIVIYDFDGTLTPFPIPKFELLEKCGIEDGLRNKEFNERIIRRAEKEKVSNYKALYDSFFEVLKDKGYVINNQLLSYGSKNVVYNKGVETFLKKLNENNIKNYLLSSGIKPYLNNLTISSYFKDIYATTFIYEKNEIKDIDFLMSDSNKVIAIKEILRNNNILENDCSSVIYIGDGLTDYYAMDYVKRNGGISIFVYNSLNERHIEKMKDVISFHTTNDYSLDGNLYKFIKEKCNIED